MLTFDPGEQGGGKLWGQGAAPPVGGLNGGLCPPVTKKDHIFVLKNALKINFSVFFRAARSLLAPTVSAVTAVVGLVPNLSESAHQLTVDPEEHYLCTIVR